MSIYSVTKPATADVLPFDEVGQQDLLPTSPAHTAVLFLLVFAQVLAPFPVTQQRQGSEPHGIGRISRDRSRCWT